MESRKAELLQRVESDRDVLIDFLRRFIRCPSPNPPATRAPRRRISAICWTGAASSIA